MKWIFQHSSAKWEKDMKFELLDPLGATVRDLFVASVIDVLRVRLF